MSPNVRIGPSLTRSVKSAHVMTLTSPRNRSAGGRRSTSLRQYRASSKRTLTVSVSAGRVDSRPRVIGLCEPCRFAYPDGTRFQVRRSFEDVEPLLHGGRSVKWAAAAILGLVVLGACSLNPIQDSDCQICRRPLRPAVHSLIRLEDGSETHVCCPRCGLHFLEGRTDVADVEVADFDTGEMIKASIAFFVEGSSVHLCCEMDSALDRSGDRYSIAWDRCMPSLTAFSTAEAAETFRSKHGGEIKIYQELSLSGAQ